MRGISKYNEKGERHKTQDGADERIVVDQTNKWYVAHRSHGLGKK
jgi:hypothetical protein